MRLLVTTVIRHAKLGEQITGRLLEVDWPSGRILRELPTPAPRHPMSNLNPRGGVRGGRGVRSCGDFVYVANYDTVFVYDTDWQPQGEISHPLTTDIHEIDVDSEGLWISCSGYDLVVKLGFGGDLLRRWHVADDRVLAKRLGVPSTPFDDSRDYRLHLPSGLDHTHLNTVQIVDPETITVGLGRVIPSTLRTRLARRLIPMSNPSRLGPLMKGALSRFRGTRSCVLKLSIGPRESTTMMASYSTLRPSHNGGVLPDGRSVLLHESCELRIGQPGRGMSSIRIKIPAHWVRGLAVIDERRVLVGTGPCGVVEVDHEKGRIERIVRLSDDPNESIHGLEFLERD